MNEPLLVERIEAIPLRCALPPAQQHVSDFGRISRFDTVLVAVHLAGGITGYGEAKPAVGSAGECAAICAAVESDLAPLVVGQDGRNVTALWWRMYSGVRADHALRSGRAMGALDRRGTRLAAISGIDIALWDALGKALQLPVHQLLGGRCRTQVPAYASGGWADADAIGDELLGYQARGGFRAFKMRVGVMDGNLDKAVARVQAARKAVGAGAELMADTHGTLSVTEAKRFCRRVEELDLAWLEEPVAADDHAGMAEVRRSTDIPIAAGESEMTQFAFRDLLAAAAVDVLQPDPAIAGGISEVHRIATLASAHLKGVAPHLWGSAILLTAGLHLAAACPNIVTLEYPMGGNPMLHELVHEPPKVRDGCLEIPERPGLGLEIDLDFVKSHRL
ncbi:MAG TPA: mandelate racemase/muconate lactonizing enzyme family protein [Limnochordia bacterium]|nr:mandelate racemase/muconate lactonizing enzyme family protein [Limnochordia bacterium]